MFKAFFYTVSSKDIYFNNIFYIRTLAADGSHKNDTVVFHLKPLHASCKCLSSSSPKYVSTILLSKN